MARNVNWTREQLLVAFSLYCKIPFGKFHSGNPDIIKYAALLGRTPSALAMKLSNIASLDPEITESGRKGLQGASANDRSMWEEMHDNWQEFAIESDRAVRNIGDGPDAGGVEIKEGSSDDKLDYSGFDRLTVTKTRIGQSFFRNAVLSSYDNKCCISGLALPNLLVASHIVPWRTDESSRLNPCNGLSLSMLHDKAFDIGIISISEQMTVMVTREIDSSKDLFFRSAISGYEDKPIALPEKFQPHPDFLQYHRENIFRKGRAA